MTQEQKSSPGTASTRPITQLDRDQHSLLVGRSTELALVRKRLEAAQNGTGRVLAFEGSSGIGKTRILDEATKIARRRGVDVARLPGRGTKQASGLVLRILLRDLLRINPNAPREAQRAMLSRVLGELGISEKTARLTELLQLTDDESPPRNPIAAANLIIDLLTARSVNERVALIALDDLDEVDEETNAILQRVAAQLADKHVLLLVTHTAAPTGWRSISTESLTLEPLSQTDIAQLAAAVIGGDTPDGATFEAVEKNTSGNPLMVRLALESFIDGQDGLPTPQSIVKQHFKAMASSESSLLAALTVLGDGTSLTHASRLELTNEELTTEAAQTLIDEGWLTPLPSTDRVAFTNAIIRDSLANSMPAEVRRKYHQRAGDYYQKASLEGPDLYTEQAITHYVRAGTTEMALTALDLAVRDAQRRGDRDAVLTLYRKALTLTVHNDNVSGGAHSTYAEKLGDFYVRERDYKEAATAYAGVPSDQAALTLRGKLGLALLTIDGVRAAHVLSHITPRIPLTYTGDFRWHLETGLTWAHALAESHYAAVRSCRSALGRLGQMTGYGQMKTLLRTMLGIVLMYQGEHGEAQAHLEASRLSWEARGEEDGLELVRLANRSAPRKAITQALLDLCLHPHVREQ